MRSEYSVGNAQSVLYGPEFTTWYSYRWLLQCGASRHVREDRYLGVQQNFSMNEEVDGEHVDNVNVDSAVYGLSAPLSQVCHVTT